MKENINISSPEFQNALSLIKFTHQSLFLTGKARGKAPSCVISDLK